MTNTVRCKLIASVIEDRGMVNLAGVYEGSQELQALTENAIFGEATPAAWGQLGPDGVAVLKSGEEYYVDLMDQLDHHGNYLLVKQVRRSFRSACGAGRVQYRFVGIAGDPANLEQTVANDKAIEMLDRLEEGWFGIKVAIGRRPDAEIALRQALIEQHIKDGFYRKSNPDIYEAQLVDLRRKLARAEGLQ